MDMSYMFKEFHPWVSGEGILSDFFVGNLQEATRPPPADAALVALHQEEWREFPLLEKKQLSKDSWWFKFGLPEGKTRVGLDGGVAAA